MEVRTDFPSSMYHTKLQWAQLGKALNADAVGIEMWVNSCQINRAIFYTVDEVHNGTQAELDEVLEPLRKKAEASRAARLREKEERLIAREKRISDSAQQRGIKKVLSLLAAAMPQAAVPEAQAIVIDTETTGLTDSDELLQISVIDDAGTVLFDSLVRPYFHTEWPEAQKVNGITPEMVAGAPYPHELLPQLVEIFSEMSVCIGYNTSFDLGFLDSMLDEAVDGSNDYRFNPVKTAKNEYRKTLVDYLNANGGTHRRASLSTCTKYFDYQWEGAAHNSLADAKATLYCYNMMKIIK